MMFLLSPAKSLDFETPAPFDLHSSPQYLQEAKSLIEIMRKKTVPEIRELMNISEKLGELNHERYRDWSEKLSGKEIKPAVFSFTGDVYTGLRADRFNQKDAEYAQENLRILSGLYGLLKPLDLIRPYRLEMGIRLKNPKGSGLYDFWKEKLTQKLCEELEQKKSKALINLASKEYSRAVDLKQIPVAVFSPEFKDLKNGEYKIISFFAKKARGLMVRYLIENRIKTPEEMLKFDLGGYKYDKSGSTEFSPVFLRDEPQPID